MPASSSQLAARFAAPGRERATSFLLGNGMQVVVLPYANRPSLTHAVWYRVGSADDPPGKTGMAHLLEHLMDKATCPVNGLGRTLEFSKTAERLGADENAFTELDGTAYYQRVAPQHLERLMALEADRMVNLQLSEEQVATERAVVLEERLGTIDKDPAEMLYEQTNAVLFLAHPYSTQVDGWAHDIQSITREDLQAFYRKFYAPNNALLVVAGGVGVDEVRRLAEATYGRIAPQPGAGRQGRATEPPHVAARQVLLRDETAAAMMMIRQYLTPTYSTAEPGEAEALDLLTYLLAESDNSHLYRALSVDDEIASETEGHYSRFNVDAGRLYFHLVAEEDVALDELAKAFDEVVHRFKADGPSADELERAKVTFISDFIWRCDNAERMARIYGRRLIGGEKLEDIEAWPLRIAAVTVDDMKRVAATYLDPRRSVTGFLVPDAVRQSVSVA